MTPKDAEAFAAQWLRLMTEIEALERRLDMARGERARLLPQRNEAIFALRLNLTTRQTAAAFGVSMGVVSGAISKELNRRGMGVQRDERPSDPNWHRSLKS